MHRILASATRGLANAFHAFMQSRLRAEMPGVDKVLASPLRSEGAHLIPLRGPHSEQLPVKLDESNETAAPASAASRALKSVTSMSCMV